MRRVRRQTLPGAAPAPAPAKQRDPWFDNAKMALVTLVVIGHSWTLLPNDDAARPTRSWLYDFLYSWHIPAFVIVTGYLSKSFEYTRARLWNLVTTVAVPYVIFEGVYALFRHVGRRRRLRTAVGQPALADVVPLRDVLLAADDADLQADAGARSSSRSSISLLAGLYANDILDNARIFGLLPFFVLGLKMHEGHWSLLRTRRARVVRHRGARRPVRGRAGSPASWIETEWLYYRSRYDALDPDNLRAIADPDAAADRRACSARSRSSPWCRARKTWFTALGGATLVVYLFHGFVVLGAEFAGFKRLGRGPLAALAGRWSRCWPWCWRSSWPGSRCRSRLNMFVDPIGTFTRRRNAWRRELRSAPSVGVTALNGTTSSCAAR